MKSLADLRAEKPSSRPERALSVCLKPDLVAEMMALTEEHDLIRDSDDGRPRKMAEGENPRVAEIRARIGELLAEIEDNEGELRLRAVTDGDWRLWVDKHPARAEGEPGHARDQEVTGGYCNADALIDSLGMFAHAWNGDLLADGDWAILADNIGAPDKKQAASAVVAMHETHLPFRQWRTALSASLNRLNGSSSPATSESPRDVSTDGNPESTTSTSTNTTPGDDAANS